MEKINNYIEHTLLNPCAAEKDIEKLTKQALENKFFGVCINPNYVELASTLLKGSTVAIVTVVNFPLANNTIDMTLYQTERVLALGAQEVDTVLNLSALKNKDYAKVEGDIKKTKEICSNHNLKVILEVDLLTNQEIIEACNCAISAGADFVKTSTGFVKNGLGATVEAVKLMYETTKNAELKVKASGGIKDYNKAKALIEAGAARLGTSSGVEIMTGRISI